MPILFKFLSKEELDLMSALDVQNYEYQIWPYSTDLQYRTELRLYQLIRFKNLQFDLYDTYVERAAAGDSACQTLSKIINRENGKEILYKVDVDGELDKIENFQYIFGLDVEIP